MLNKMILVIVLCLMVSLSAVAGETRKVDPHKAYEMLQQDKSIFLLDVRTPQEFQKVRLDGAHLIPIDNFVAREQEMPKNRPIIVYCEIGHRSEQVAAYLAAKGYPEVYDLQGGIWAWQLRKLPVLQGLP